MSGVQLMTLMHARYIATALGTELMKGYPDGISVCTDRHTARERRLPYFVQLAAEEHKRYFKYKVHPQ